jgi:phage gp16-like protein
VINWMRFGIVYNLIVLVLIFHYDFIYCAQKTSEAAVASALPLALPQQRLQTVASSSTVALVLRPQAAPQQRSGVLSPDPHSHDDQRTMEVQVVLQAQSSGRPAVWVLRRAMASMLGQDVCARWQRVFERQPERPVELHRLAGHGTRSTNSAEAKISACEKCRQNKVTSWPQGTTQRRVSCTYWTLLGTPSSRSTRHLPRLPLPMRKPGVNYRIW